ncbi:YoaK family protein [Streptomyces radicis]|uniref:DUF1275 domain-containing protein n=1 Tax=Streptomyces radicis TaxID=1750517 RepID=A0A3A9WDW2_9ACTN|nr:YoaK family protein [Streptomyces radicis]RKN10969.1 DUF1275 domain-containing protein [Streptomyces radicis]RKN25232.1 DUF1275 domain-containing protein [Streptomyces radicis]
MTNGARRRGARRVDAVLVLLTFTAGITDAISFFGLGGVFTANMTGNLVLVGMSAAAGGSWAELLTGDVLRCTASFAGFAVGMLAGFRLLPAASPARPGSPWPRGFAAALAVVLALHVAFLAGWAATGARPGGAEGAALILVSAAAMGTQTAAARGLDRAGITSTFVTGTLTSLIAGLATGDRRHAGLRCGILGALLVGGLAGGLLLARWNVAAAAVAPATTALVVTLAAMRGPRRRTASARG